MHGQAGQMDLSQSVGACQVCRSTRYHKTDDGFLVCEFGHQSQKFWEEADDGDTFLGTTRRQIRASQLSGSRLSQVLSEDASAEILRSGDVEKFTALEMTQIILKAQLEDLGRLLPNLPFLFESTIKSIWLSYVSNLDMAYGEEGIQADSETQAGLDTYANSAAAPSFTSSPTMPDFDSDGEASAEADHGHASKSPHRFSCTIPIIALACAYHGLPVYLGDIYRWVVTGKLMFFQAHQLVPKSIEALLTGRQKSYLRNPVIPGYTGLGKSLVSLSRTLQSRLGIELPTLDCRLLMWRLGEELSLPYIFREDLIALSVRLGNDYTLGIIHERIPPNPLLGAFACSVFWLKLQYGLLEGRFSQADANFASSGFPTLYQLVQAWKKRARDLEFPVDYTKDLDFVREHIVKARTEPSSSSTDDFTLIRRSLDIGPPPAAASVQAPSWLRTDPELEIQIEPVFAKKYPCFEASYPEAYRLLLELGSRFCCCDETTVHTAVRTMFETKPAQQLIRSVF